MIIEQVSREWRR